LADAPISTNASQLPRQHARASQLALLRFFLVLRRDSRVLAWSLDFFRLRRRLISFCRSLAIYSLFLV